MEISPVMPCGQKGDTSGSSTKKSHQAEQNYQCGHFREVPAVFRGYYPSRLCLQTWKWQTTGPCSSLSLFRVTHMVTNEDPSHSHAKPSHVIPFTSYVAPYRVLRTPTCRGSMSPQHVTDWDVLPMYGQSVHFLWQKSSTGHLSTASRSLQGLQRTSWVYHSLS